MIDEHCMGVDCARRVGSEVLIRLVALGMRVALLKVMVSVGFIVVCVDVCRE